MKNIIKGLGRVAASGLVAVTLAVNSGCEKQPAEHNPVEDNITMKVGESQTGFYGRYCGMPIAETFSLAPYSGNNSCETAFNVFYPVSSKRIHFDNKDYDVILVTPESLTLRKVDKKPENDTKK